MRKIRIINEDGIGRNTKIIDKESGECISGITDLVVKAGVNGLVTVYLKLINVEVDIVATEEGEVQIPKLRRARK
jgi:hypothetical protein